MKTYILFIGCFIIALASIYIYFYFLAQSLPYFFQVQGRVAGLWLPWQGLTWFARFVASVAFNMPADGRGSQAVARAAQGDAREGRGGATEGELMACGFCRRCGFNSRDRPYVHPFSYPPPHHPIPVRATAFGYNLVFQAAAPQNAFHSASNFVSFSVFGFRLLFFSIFHFRAVHVAAP